MNTDFSQFSKGCQLCQQGKWLCIFLTYKCTANCHFCPAPLKNDEIHSAFGNQKEQILKYLKENNFEGISFSGGDPFLVFDRMFEWLTFFKSELPENYYFWVYTNGLAVNKDKLKQLADAGMDEIRFNIAATNYLSVKIWEQIKIARKYFSFVSIEIPSIKNDYFKLIKALNSIEQYGIDFLNLHDYIVSETEIKQTKEPHEEFLLNKTNVLNFAISTTKNTYKILKYSKSNRYSFKINHCSMQQKEKQMLQRRLKMGSVFNNPELDIGIDAGLICNYYKFPNWFNNKNIEKVLLGLEPKYKKESFIISKNEINNWIQKPHDKIIKAINIPKMEVNGNKTLIDWQVIK